MVNVVSLVATVCIAEREVIDKFLENEKKKDIVKKVSMIILLKKRL